MTHRPAPQTFSNRLSGSRLLRGVMLMAALTLPLTAMLGLSACASGLLPKPHAQATLLVLQAPPADAFLPMPMPKPMPAPQAALLTLIVETPRAAAGFDTRDIAYVRRAYEVEYFAVHQWVDTPARMVAPIMVQALQRSGSLRSVVLAPTVAAGELRLETELVRLQQDFTCTPSHVRMSMRVLLVDAATRRPLAWRELDAVVLSPSEDPYGGAVAANATLAQVLQQLVAFVAQSVPR